MISGRLVEAIQNRWQEISARLIRKLRHHPETPRMAERSDAELREWCQLVLEDLAQVLADGRGDGERRTYEGQGRARFAEHMPLHEAVLRLHMLKEAVMEFIEEESIPVNSMQLYAQADLDRRVNRFFDALVYYLVNGYEKAMNSAVRYA